MSKFKVGDRVKTIFGLGKIVEINKKNSCSYLVCHDDWNQGHNAEVQRPGKYSGHHCWWFEGNELKLVEPSTISEINIDSSGIKITCDNLQTTNLIIDRNQELYDWWEALKKAKMFPNQKNYKNWFMGIWEKDNPIIEKKEGNDMLESLNLVDLYASKQKEIINNKYSKMIEDIRNKSSIKEQYDKITQNCINELNNLFTSQFSDEEREELKETISGSDLNKEMKRKTSCYEFGYYIDTNYVNEDIKELQEKCENELKELDSLMKTVKAHVGIAKTKEEVEEILTRYEILDKKGKLKI